MHDLQPINDHVDRIHAAVMMAVSTADTPEDIINILSLVESIARRVREDWKRAAEQQALDYIAEHGDFTVGQKRYYAGVDRRYVAKDRGALLDLVIAAAFGDLEKAAEYLASDAFKPGMIREYLEENVGKAKFSDLFETIEKADLRTGVPKKTLKSLPVEAKESSNV